MSVQLSQKEQESLVLGVVEACLQYSEIHNENFEDVLKETIFVGKAKSDVSTMYCKIIKSLCEKEYLHGDVKIAHELEFDSDTLEESETDEIDFENTRFIDISMSPKGQALLNGDSLEVLRINVTEKAKSALSALIDTEIPREILVKTATNFICSLI